MPPILDNKSPSSPSVFAPAALLREARRQKGLPVVDVPRVCIFDPDGDIVRRLKSFGLRSTLMRGPAITPIFIPSRLVGRQLAFSGALLARPLRYWSLRNCSLVDVAS